VIIPGINTIKVLEKGIAAKKLTGYLFSCGEIKFDTESNQFFK